MTGIGAHGSTNADGTVKILGAGPALVLSFVLAGIACVFAGLCYAEFASMIPLAGSAYTYAYATLGELFAWIIGWDLVLEYMMGAATVSVGWSGYLTKFLKLFGLHLPDWMTNDWITYSRLAHDAAAAGTPLPGPPEILGVPIVFNLLALLVALFVTSVLAIGIQESARFNAGIVAVKVSVVVMVILVGAFFVKPVNWGAGWSEFAPNGFAGIASGAAYIFFAYIGFDAISTTAQEAKNPQKDMPFGIIGSLADLHGPLHRGGGRPDRHDEVEPDRPEGPDRAGLRELPTRLGRLPDHRRRARGPHLGHARHAPRADARLLRHVARRSPPEEGLRRGPQTLPDARSR